LAEAFGGKPPLEEGYASLVKWYLDFSDRWDFRSHQRIAYDGKASDGARWLINNDDLSESQKTIAIMAASKLGLRQQDRLVMRNEKRLTYAPNAATELDFPLNGAAHCRV
jgi:hypothetical protein